MREPPRLSKCLRYELCEREPYNYSEEVLSRQQQLETRRRLRGTRKRGSSKSSQLTWQWLAGRLSKANDKEVLATKKHFHAFIAQVSSLLGDEAPSEEVRTAAWFLFLHLHNIELPGKEETAVAWHANLPAEVRKKVKTYIGAVSPQELCTVATAVSELFQWRQRHAKDIQGGDPFAAVELKKQETFGSSIALQFPLRPGTLYGNGPTAFGIADHSVMSPWLASLRAFSLKAFGQTSYDAAIAGAFEESKGEANTAAAASSAPTEAKAIDEVWLYDCCEQHIAMSGMDTFTPTQLGKELLAIMKPSPSKVPDEELQGRLFDFLGITGIDFISMLLQHRDKLRRIPVNAMNQALKKKEQAGRSLGPASGQRHSKGATVTVTTESQARLSQRARRQLRRADPLVEAGFDPAYLDQERALGLQGGKGPALSKGAIVEQQLNAGGIMASYGLMGASADSFDVDQRRGLPKGSKRTFHEEEKYEEIFVPAPKRKEKAGGPRRRIPIHELEPFAQVVFKGMKELNELQSEVFPTAYGKDENLLVCAPTGAGKTNVALLTVCREVGQHFANGVLARNEFKIVYVAPMKALAQEVVEKFSKRLSGLGLVVRELTGDMQLTKREIEETQVIVTTPEKWDVITRKASDSSLIELVKLLIIDEVHLLADERGAVLESIVARTLRMVEASQSHVRIVGLSATLPNYKDVALFLNANLHTGLFHFGPAYRPVPLEQTFVGVTEHNALKRLQYMNRIAFKYTMKSVKAGNQVMIFVHSRKDTSKTAQAMRDLAMDDGSIKLLEGRSSKAGGSGHREGLGSGARYEKLVGDVAKSKNEDVRKLFECGMGIHHAGMLRSDRNLTEQLFAVGAIKVLVCTATLAWGVNLPAHTVIIKGTQVYNAEAGGFTDLSMLDVTQIFGRAGRPQYDTLGEGIIITSHDRLAHYTSLLIEQKPIESSFSKSLPDHLNAEIVSGTVTNIREAVEWLRYTYMYIRMLRAPGWKDQDTDPMLFSRLMDLVILAAKRLDECRMCRFDERSGNLAATDLGRVASHFYLKHETVETFNRLMKPYMPDGDIINLICHAEEFNAMKVRDEEINELDRLAASPSVLRLPLRTTLAEGGKHVSVKRDDNTFRPEKEYEELRKVNILLQAYISRAGLRSFTLISDLSLITQSAGRISRALFEISLRKGWSSMADRLLEVSKAIDLRQWWMDTPLRQFPKISLDILAKMDRKVMTMSRIRDMSAAEIGATLKHPRAGSLVKTFASYIPHLEVESEIQPITRGILRVTLRLYPSFTWNDRYHGQVVPWWIWVEDGDSERIYHSENLNLTKKQALSEEPVVLTFTIPIAEPLPSQYWVRCISDRWMGAETVTEMSFQHLILPDKHPPHTDLLDLTPLPKTALHNSQYEGIYSFSHFNPIQTQVFHVLYHTDTNVLLGAPTGSGKTVAAELAMFRLFNAHPGKTAVYIAPLKALVAERIKDWKKKFGPMGKKVVELTGDFTPDVKALKQADVIITTPEKWDGVSRGWHKRGYVKKVGTVIIDEIHLLGEERGPILEVIVSRMRYISSHTSNVVRIVGLSTALANARDLADWLGIERVGLYNFRPSVRPIPMEVHIQGFPGKHYCPRMATMNKPTYAAIMTHSPSKPTLVFVASRRQTRLTALELISLSAADENPKKFLHMPEHEISALCSRVRDKALQHTLAFGVGIHHAGLNETDRSIVEELFVYGKIQVLVCTATLAWGVNFPAHLVVVKGTEFFDGKLGRYVDFPITDVLQMMGRAGRPQFDDYGVACILVHEPKKNFYKKFLYEPFPVESHLKEYLHDHINAEVASGTITSRQDAVDYLSWTYFFRRLLQNPTFYGLESTKFEDVKEFLLGLVDATLEDLADAGCVLLGTDEDGNEDEDHPDAVMSTTSGYIASYYYLKYRTVGIFREALGEDNSMEALCRLMCNACEYDELPVRHNEDHLNGQLATLLPWKVPVNLLDDSHAKAFLLLQAHFGHVPLPITDYINDTKSVLDQAIRIINAMVDIAADMGLLHTCLELMELSQCVVQGRFNDESTLLQLPYITESVIKALHNDSDAFLQAPRLIRGGGDAEAREFLPLSVSELMHSDVKALEKALARAGLSTQRSAAAVKALRQLPVVKVRWSVHGVVEEDEEEEERKGNKPRLSRDIYTDSEALVKVKISVENNQTAKKKAHAPRFPKPKDLGFWLVVGDAAAPPDESLLALKRIPFPSATMVHDLIIPTPSTPGKHQLQLYIMCDSFSGIDQQYAVSLNVLEGSAE